MGLVEGGGEGDTKRTRTDGNIVANRHRLSHHLRPFLSLSFVHVTLHVTSSQIREVSVRRPFV